MPNNPSENLPFHVGLAALKDAGAVRVVFEYSGGGDSGGIDTIRAERDNSATVPIEHQLYNLLMEWGDENAFPQTGWWNNEGGSGTCTLDLDTMVATVEHTDNFDEDGEETTEVLALPDDAVAWLLAERAQLTDNDVVEFPLYADGPNWMVDRHDLPTEKFKVPVPGWTNELQPAAQAFVEAIEEELADWPTGENGGGGTVTVHYAEDGTLTATVTVTPTEEGHETSSYEVEL